MKTVIYFWASGPTPLTALDNRLARWSEADYVRHSLVPQLAEHALWWALLLDACTTGRVGSVVRATLLRKNVVEEATRGATTLAVERGLRGGGGISRRRHDGCLGFESGCCSVVLCFDEKICLIE